MNGCLEYYHNIIPHNKLLEKPTEVHEMRSDLNASQPFRNIYFSCLRPLSPQVNLIHNHSVTQTNLTCFTRNGKQLYETSVTKNIV
jgi:hypothetical protein